MSIRAISTLGDKPNGQDTLTSSPIKKAPKATITMMRTGESDLSLTDKTREKISMANIVNGKDRNNS
ncbi:hypothetical protein KBA01_23270 [Kozakia baliensis]|nr:hypothetical protein KBA01_23270 [Kozakia baliensis]